MYYLSLCHINIIKPYMLYIIIYVVRVYILYNGAFLYLELFKGLTSAAFSSTYKPLGPQSVLWTIQAGIFYCA